ncbi:hypothetical protein LINPERPRIM_LOCUS17830 [Linum perenne]
MFDVSSTFAQTSFLIQDMKTKSADVYHGDHNCRAKFTQLLADIGLPTGLLVVDDIEEFGHVKKTGFVWLKLKKNSCKFDNVDLCYDDVITASFQKNRIKNLTGVKAKEFLFWFTLSEVYVNTCSSPTITFKTPSGLSKSFPLSMFVGAAAEKAAAVEDGEVAAKLGIQLAL